MEFDIESHGKSKYNKCELDLCSDFLGHGV